MRHYHRGAVPAPSLLAPSGTKPRLGGSPHRDGACALWWSQQDSLGRGSRSALLRRLQCGWVGPIVYMGSGVGL